MRIVLIIILALALSVPSAWAQGNGNGPPESNGSPGNSGNRDDNASAGASNGNGNGNGPPENRGKTGNNGKGGGNGNGQDSSPDSDAGGNSGQSQGNEATAGMPSAVGSSAEAEPIMEFSEDAARDAASSGQAVSLGSLLPDVVTRTGGDMIDARLLRVQGFMVYELKVLAPDGRVTTEYYYAQSGIFIGSEP